MANVRTLPSLLVAGLLSFGIATGPAFAQAMPAPPSDTSAPVAPLAPATGPVETVQVPGAIPSESSSVTPDADAVPDPALPHDLSPVGMFLAADTIVKGVMIALALASVATWSILLFKLVELGTAKARLRSAVVRLSEATGLRDAANGDAIKSAPARAMLIAASRELETSEQVLDLVPGAGVKERVASHLSRIETGAGKKIATGTGILATVGSISPFVGLFGTVWGIMNSFIGISQAQTTNLAIVAPGIAEALLATAIGLVAAIPAVVIYNYFARAIAGYRLILGDASSAVDRLVSRDLDFRLARRLSRQPADIHRQGEAPVARAR